jgi:hypothetical protein
MRPIVKQISSPTATSKVLGSILFFLLTTSGLKALITSSLIHYDLRRSFVDSLFIRGYVVLGLITLKAAIFGSTRLKLVPYMEDQRPL